MSTPIAAAQALWEPAGTYLNTASFGLPPRPGLGCAPGGARRLAHGPDELGAVGRRDRGGAGVVRAARRACRRRRWPSARPSRGSSASSPRRCRTGSRVLAPDVEFTSTLFPFLVQAHRGVTVRTVPAAELAGAIDDSTDVVAFSAVQMATGEVADLAAIAAAAKAHGALTLVDATQACGWLPLDGYGFDVVVVAGYKWLLSPRGTAYMAVAPERLAEVVPTAAGWFAGEDVHASYFGGPLRLAADARRLDTSPAWHSWVGAAPALALLEEIGVERDPRARPRAGEPLPGGPRARAGRLGNRVRRRARRRGSPRAGGDQGGRARRPGAHVVAPLQHRRGRRPGARGAGEA